MPKLREAGEVTNYYNDFSGGANLYLGPRQIKDNESPDSINNDFKGKGGVGNRDGYSQIGSVGATYDLGIFGMSEYHTSTKDQIIKFASDGANVVLNYCDDGLNWTAVTGTKFTDGTDIDVVQAVSTAAAALTNTDGTLFSFNGTDQMVKYNGVDWAAHTGATKGYYGAYFDKRLWCVDEEYKDTLNYSTKTPDATKPLDFATNGTSSNPGTATFKPGSGQEITGMINFKNQLYVFLRSSIYRIATTSTVNEFTIQLVTNAVGCVSHRSICQVGEDVFFAADDGVYSLGDVANYTEVRTTNKSARIQKLFDGLSATSKAKLVGKYHNFKYHLFYSNDGVNNDSCVAFDVRYGGWQNWRNIACRAATLFTGSSNQTDLYIGHPTTGAVYKMYSGTTDDGTAISSYWTSKSFDEEMFDIIKKYLVTTWNLGALNGKVNLYVIFNDTEVGGSLSLSQVNPTGGFGRSAFGRSNMEATNTDLAVGGFGMLSDAVSVDQVINMPWRIKAKAKKFAVQYKIENYNGST
jgi:hypothetical protein